MAESNSKNLKEIAVVTDSASDVPLEYCQRYNINVVPLYIHHNGREYKDGIEINSDLIYKLQKDKKAIFNSSSPSPNDFYVLYKNLLEKYRQIISIHLSSKLSAVINSARLARDMLKAEEKIVIYDSFSGTMGTGFMAIAAAKAALRQYKTAKILEILDFLRENIKLYGTIDTLKYLSLSGRVPRLANIVSSIFKIKPLLGIKDGSVGMIGIAITRHGSIAEITRRVIRKFRKEDWVFAAIVHSLSLEESEKIKVKLTSYLKCIDFIITGCTPVVGAHAGPGLIGIIVSKLNPDIVKLFKP